ncbi:N-terminal nucleophile aminohydrolase, partial [Patellaria atrata CBS 101060]
IKPRIIIHGGAGNISHETVPPSAMSEYRQSLLSVLSSCNLLLSHPSATALDIATYAVALLENNPLFNCGHGAVFTRSGTIELEASIMVSDGHHKRGVGCMLLERVKNPIKLAREMLVRGDDENGWGGGAGGHSQLSGRALEKLAERWGLEMVDPRYFWTRKRWDEHIRGLEREKKGKHGKDIYRHDIQPLDWGKEPGWDGEEYLPQGTVGAVVLDRFGTICVATSTGGLTNKLPGRIGDTPTLGAGFWAEQWEEKTPKMLYQPSPPVLNTSLDQLSRGDISSFLSACLPHGLSSTTQPLPSLEKQKPSKQHRALAMSGTGNGDSFLRVSACRTAAAMCRFSTPAPSLQTAVSEVAGPGGELQRSAGERWGNGTFDGEGGIIGIELIDGEGKVAFDFNCGGMFRAYYDDEGKPRFGCFH